MAHFNFEAFKRAFEAKDAEAWLSFFTPDAEWIEYRDKAPPKAPNRMVGTQQIGDFLRRVSTTDIVLAITDEVLGQERAAFCVTCAFPDGNKIIENVIVHLQDGKIVRQVDVEAWD